MLKLNGQLVNITMFSDNTSQVWKLKDIPEVANIEWTFDHEGELMHLAQLVILLRQLDVHKKITLHIPFLPYGRQDKLISNDSTFALHVFAYFVNTLRLDKVTSLDAHSEVPYWVIDNFHNLFPYYEIEKVVNSVNPDIICFPDKGARERYGKELSFLNKIHIFGEKERDQLTGNIVKYTLDYDVKDANILIVDDICDGGMTFILLTKALLTAGAKSVSLYTTHGIYSKGVGVLKNAGIKRIFNHSGEIFNYPLTNGFTVQSF